MKIFLTIAAIMALIMVSFVVYGVSQASPVVTGASASVGVNEIISFTVTDISGGGITFTDFNPGSNDNAAVPNPAVDLTVESATNVNVTISLKGVDWSGPAAMTLANTNVKFDDDSTLGQDGAETAEFEGVLTTAFQDWYGVVAPAGGSAATTSVFHFVSIPANQRAGDYTSTFTYRASSQP